MDNQEIAEHAVSLAKEGALVKRLKGMVGLVAGGLMSLGVLPAPAESNLCPNASFDAAKSPLEGWGVNYDWTGNSKQMGNQDNISVLPEFQGRRHVLKVGVPKDYESKVETPLIAYEPGARYTCTFDLYEDVGSVRILFLGYNWRPGVAPSDEPKHQDMRRLYKGDVIETHKGAAWKTVSVTFPHEEISELAYNHLKKVRYVTLFLFVPGATGFSGNFYISNLKMVKLPGKCKVRKGSIKSSGSES